MSHPPKEIIETVIASGVKILETAGRNPEPYREIIAEGGLIHIHKCARVRDAVKVDQMGADAVSIVGTECGGHPSMEGVTSLVLVPQAADAIRAPLIAGGGFSDGRTLVVALALDIVWEVRRFGLIQAMTQGGPGVLTEVLSTYTYKQYFQFFRFEYASAISVVMTIVLLLVSLPYIWMISQEE